MTNYSGLL